MIRNLIYITALSDPGSGAGSSALAFDANTVNNVNYIVLAPKTIFRAYDAANAQYYVFSNNNTASLAFTAPGTSLVAKYHAAFLP